MVKNQHNDTKRQRYFSIEWEQFSMAFNRKQNAFGVKRNVWNGAIERKEAE
jgi:hypothetical protein